MKLIRVVTEVRLSKIIEIDPTLTGDALLDAISTALPDFKSWDSVTIDTELYYNMDNTPFTV